MASRAMTAKFLELSKPPGSPKLWFGLGAVIRSVGDVVDNVGRMIMMGSGHDEKLPIPCTAVSLGGKTPSIGQNFVAPSATLAGQVDLKPGASIWYGAIVRAQGAAITIGELSNVQENATLTSRPAMPLSIGKLVTIGAGSIVDASTLGDGCTLGCGCIVPSGSTIGANAFIAAGSVLPPKANVPAGQVWAGKPAKRVSEFSAAEAESAAADARGLCALSVVHNEHAWMSLADIEFTALQYKMEKARPENWSQQLRDAPVFEPLPKLRARIAEVSARLA